MHTFLWVFIAAAIGFMLFATLQEQLPDELGFLRMNTDGTAVIEDPSPPSPGAWQHYRINGWDVQRSGTSLALSRSFRGSLMVNGQTFDTPQLGILCHAGDLNIRIDTRLPTTGTATTPISVEGTKQEWDKGAQGFNVIARDGGAVLKRLLKAKDVAEFTVSYRDLGVQPVQVSVDGLAELVGQMPASCQP